VQRLLGIDYDIRGAIQLRDEEGFYEQPMTTAPRAVHVPVAKQRAAAIDALMMSALACPANPHRPFALVGLEYADGSVADLPVRCDFDLFHWRQISALGDHAQVAVRGLDARLVALLWRPVHVYAVHLANPHPEKAVQGVKTGRWAGFRRRTNVPCGHAPTRAGGRCQWALDSRSPPAAVSPLPCCCCRFGSR
jgi:hypothetical protein